MFNGMLTMELALRGDVKHFRKAKHDITAAQGAELGL